MYPLLFSFSKLPTRAKLSSFAGDDLMAVTMTGTKYHLHAKIFYRKQIILAPCCYRKMNIPIKRIIDMKMDCDCVFFCVSVRLAILTENSYFMNRYFPLAV